MSKIHDLKCWPEFFQAIKRGDKTFEIRLDDRDYQVGDTLHQREWKPEVKHCDVHYYLEGDGRCTCHKGDYTGDELSMEVTYKMKGGQFGLPDTHCILGFKSPVLAAEIKRLEAVHEHDQKLLDGATNLGIALGDKVVKLEARIALLESALELPEGCDPFNFERAEKGGAVAEDGSRWRYSERRGVVTCFCIEGDETEIMCVDPQGYCYGLGKFGRLYCRKGGANG